MAGYDQAAFQQVDQLVFTGHWEISLGRTLSLVNASQWVILKSNDAFLDFLLTFRLGFGRRSETIIDNASLPRADGRQTVHPLTTSAMAHGGRMVEFRETNLQFRKA